MTLGYKVFTHDGRSPIQGGEPVWTGELPYTLPAVALDTSDNECAPGWNYALDLADALVIAGLWPTERPSIAVEVEPAADAITRGAKSRASSLRLVRRCTDDEIEDAITRLSAYFGAHAARMAEEQHAWRRALARPHHDAARVQSSLKDALASRGLAWDLVQYDDDAAAAWAVWDAKVSRDKNRAKNMWDAWDAWNAKAWDAWDAWGWRANETRDAWGARKPRNDSTWSAWGAVRAATDAQLALTMMYAGLSGMRKLGTEELIYPADLLTVGIRDAYAYGLELAVPVGPATLGWAMTKHGR